MLIVPLFRRVRVGCLPEVFLKLTPGDHDMIVIPWTPVLELPTWTVDWGQLQMPGLVVRLGVARTYHSQSFGSDSLGDLLFLRLFLDIPMGCGWGNGNIDPPWTLNMWPATYRLFE